MTTGPFDTAAGMVLDAGERLGIGLLLTRTGRIVGANHVAGRLLGFGASTLVGRTLMEAFLDHRIEELVAGAPRDGAGPLEVSTLGEPRLMLEVRSWPSGAGSAWIAVQDVTEIQRLRRIRAEFIDNLAHELRTPLASVRLLSELLALELDRADVPARAREVARKIDIETARLAQMATELLDLAAIEQGEAPLRREDVELAGVVNDVLERLRPQAQGSGVQLSARTSDDGQATDLTGDRESLSRMIQNLVDNAIKFSPSGAEVEVGVSSGAAGLIVSVADRGPGIPAAERDRVFERFYKVDRARGGPGGTGLGLSIARHIAERHGGRIWVEGREGGGSTFVAELPRRAPGGQAGG